MREEDTNLSSCRGCEPINLRNYWLIEESDFLKDRCQDVEGVFVERLFFPFQFFEVVSRTDDFA